MFQKGDLPEKRVSLAVQRAVEHYDQRFAATWHPLSRFGSVVTSRNRMAGTDRILWVQRCKPSVVPAVAPGIPLAEAKEKDWIDIKANFSLDLLSIQKLQELVLDRRCNLDVLFTREAAALLYLLSFAPSLVLRHGAGVYSSFQSGYLLWKDGKQLFEGHSRFFDIVPDFVRQILQSASVRNSSEVWETLKGIEGNDWPLAADPVFRHEGNAICIDLTTATSRLDAALEFPVLQGDLANARADHFEEEVQSVIDKSKWSPHSSVAQLRRKTLKRDGAGITDIDAIGENDGTLLLVSCKSILYSGLYDIGDYRTIRNVASNIKQAIQYWQTVLENLRGNPVGDNFDFLSFKKIIGVVCTPHIVFLENEVLRESPDSDLPMAFSISEFASWLGTRDSFWAN